VRKQPSKQQKRITASLGKSGKGMLAQTLASASHANGANALIKPNEPQLVRPLVTRKLDLACGQSPPEGWEGVDIWQGAQHRVDLMTYPWPFDDESCAELRCSHFIEHIPMIYLDAFGDEVPMGTPGAKDALFKFFEECWRILVPDGWMEIIVPSGKSNRGFQDPTHRRFFVPETFGYFSADWRKSVSLDHYATDANFTANVVMTCTPEMNLHAPEVTQRKFNSEWNAAFDYVVKMQKKPKHA
jgi:predicted SAM-dependent methyltransferase